MIASSMPIGPVGFTPTGFIDFCARRPDQCGIAGETAGEPLRARLVRQQWTQILSPASIQGQGVSEAPPAPFVLVEPQSSLAVSAVLQTPVAPDQPAAATAEAVGIPILNVGGTFELSFQPDAVLTVDMAPEATAPAPISEVSLAEARILSAPPASASPLQLTASPSAFVTPTPERLSSFEAPSHPAVLAISDANWSLLQRVNQDINARILPASDMTAFGQEDYWTLPISAGGQPRGNCKHYALEKLKALAEAGIPRDALTLAIPRTGWGELHAVLIVATDHGDFVLDNLNSRIVPWDRTGYHWIARQTPGAPLRWMDLERAEARRG